MPFLELPDGCRLHHHVAGDRGPWLTLLEGMGGDLPGWRRNIPRLAGRCRVLAFDLRGNGESDAPDAPMTLETFVGDTLSLLDHLGIEQAHLYGQSFGGMVALEIALTHPRRVRSLILAATHGGSAHMTETRERAPKDRPWELLYAPGFPEANPGHVREDLEAGIPQAPHARRRQWEAMREWSAWDRLGEVAVPTLVLHGTEDRLIPVENARRLADGIPGARLHLLEGAGHVYHSERAAEADEAVLGFVAEVEAG